MPSPYELVLGPRLSELHPQLVTYFSEIPDGFVGIGSGVFITVGTPKRWLWPALWVLKRQGVLFPVWEHQVPFTVLNRPVRGSQGASVVAATRTFHFRSGDQSMVDSIAAGPAGLVDSLGRNGRYQAQLVARVTDGALEMKSQGVAVRIGRAVLRFPRLLAPRVHLSERFDDGEQNQHVSVTVVAPVLGRLYEYAGSFRYELKPESGVYA